MIEVFHHSFAARHHADIFASKTFGLQVRNGKFQFTPLAKLQQPPLRYMYHFSDIIRSFGNGLVHDSEDLGRKPIHFSALFAVT